MKGTPNKKVRRDDGEGSNDIGSVFKTIAGSSYFRNRSMQFSVQLLYAEGDLRKRL